MNEFISEPYVDFDCEHCDNYACAVKRGAPEERVDCELMENETAIRLRDFVRTYCSALGPESIFRSAAYHTFSSVCSGGGNEVRVTAGSTASPCEVNVKVFRLAKETLVESAAKVAAEGREKAFYPELPLDMLPFDIPVFFAENRELSFRINHIPFSFSGDTTMAELMQAVNNDSAAAVTMSYDSKKSIFSLRSDYSGAGSGIVIQNDKGALFGERASLKIPEGSFNSGCSALAEIDGEFITSDGNEIPRGGLNFFLNEVTGDGGVTIKVTRDIEATVRLLSRFINELSGFVSAFAKSENRYIRNLANQLRDAFTHITGGTGVTAETAGIVKVDEYGFSANAEGIQRAIENNTEQIEQLFTNGGDGTEMGVAYKVKEAVEQYLSIWRAEKMQNTDEENPVSAEIRSLVEKYRGNNSGLCAANIT